jgi:hypothetical protein
MFGEYTVEIWTARKTTVVNASVLSASWPDASVQTLTDW